MVLLTLLTLAMVVFLMVTAWSALREAMADDKAGPAKNSGQTRGVAKPVTLEDVLVRQLMDEQISGSQYSHAMRRLAERDADRHPLTVPPED